MYCIFGVFCTYDEGMFACDPCDKPVSAGIDGEFPSFPSQQYSIPEALLDMKGGRRQAAWECSDLSDSKSSEGT